MDYEYYNDLIDQNKCNSAYSVQLEYERIKRIEEGRRNAMADSPLFVELKKQTGQNEETILNQRQEIEFFKNQISMLEEYDKVQEKRARSSTIISVISITVAVISIVVSILLRLL